MNDTRKKISTSHFCTYGASALYGEESVTNSTIKGSLILTIKVFYRYSFIPEINNFHQ